MNTKDLMEKRELATKLGDISACLANKDVELAYKLVNELYSKYIKYDTKK